jgi:hypothetical protein
MPDEEIKFVRLRGCPVPELCKEIEATLDMPDGLVQKITEGIGEITGGAPYVLHKLWLNNVPCFGLSIITGHDELSGQVNAGLLFVLATDTIVAMVTHEKELKADGTVN